MLERIRSARDEGFTLIELLIVIVILGILAAIVVFAVGSATSDSKLSACKADKKTLGVALEAYKAKVGTYPAAQSASSNALLVPGYMRTWPGSSDGTTTIFATDATGAITVTGSTTC
ncbi:MAG: ral secretion pathway protein [Frankiaceae bacterium]|jgi:general secretion pathway protein G|nr:ral secretion pathway protein [Frankiaceae bacterium]